MLSLLYCMQDAALPTYIHRSPISSSIHRTSTVQYCSYKLYITSSADVFLVGDVYTPFFIIQAHAVSHACAPCNVIIILNVSP